MSNMTVHLHDIIKITIDGPKEFVSNFTQEKYIVQDLIVHALDGSRTTLSLFSVHGDPAIKIETKP